MDSPDLVCTTVVALSGKITRAKAQLPGSISLSLVVLRGSSFKSLSVVVPRSAVLVLVLVLVWVLVLVVCGGGGVVVVGVVGGLCCWC